MKQELKHLGFKENKQGDMWGSMHIRGDLHRYVVIIDPSKPSIVFLELNGETDVERTIDDIESAKLPQTSGIRSVWEKLIKPMSDDWEDRPNGSNN